MSFHVLNSLPLSHSGVSEWLCEAEKPAGVKTQDPSKENFSNLPPAKKTWQNFD